jgi:hypothetical protein
MKKYTFCFTCISLLFLNNIFSQDKDCRMIIYDTKGLLTTSELYSCALNITEFINNCRKNILPKLRNMSDSCKIKVANLWYERPFTFENPISEDLKSKEGLMYSHLSKKNDSILELRIHDLIFDTKEIEKLRYTGVFELSKNEIINFYISGYSSIYNNHPEADNNINVKIKNFIDKFLVAYMSGDSTFVIDKSCYMDVHITKRKMNDKNKEIEMSSFQGAENFKLDKNIKFIYNIDDFEIQRTHTSTVTNKKHYITEIPLYVDNNGKKTFTELQITWKDSEREDYIVELTWTEYEYTE